MSNAGEMIAGEIVSQLIIDAVYAEAIMPALIKKAEGTTNKVNILITLTDLLLNSTGLGGLEPYAFELSKALANKVDSDSLRAAQLFETIVGGINKPMTEHDLLSAIYALEMGEARGPFACVLSSLQIKQLREDIANHGSTIWSSASAPGEDLGAFASLHGVDIFKSYNCPAVNHGKGILGVMMPVGNQSGLEYLLKKIDRTEYQRDPSLRATEILTDNFYKNDCVDTTASGGVSIVSKGLGHVPERDMNQTSISRNMRARGAVPLYADMYGGIGFMEEDCENYNEDIWFDTGTMMEDGKTSLIVSTSNELEYMKFEKRGWKELSK